MEEIAIRKARFTEHQIIAVLKSVEAGRTVKDVCREAGISEASYYNWKAKFGGMEASQSPIHRTPDHRRSEVRRSRTHRQRCVPRSRDF
ncbi:transposase [Klebsiella pneumoniae]|uniref:transposase n=1 Tax=Klebsiella pneumoniae TaxID=573 RepID=UPI003B211D95